MSPVRRRRTTVITRPMARRRRRRRALLALGVTTALVAGAAYGTWRYIEENEFLLDERCAVTVGDRDYELSPTQTRNAALLAVTAVNQGLPPEAGVDALAMSLQETELSIRDSGEERGSEALFARGSPDWNAENGARPVQVTVDGFYEVLEESWRAGIEAADDGEEDADLFWTPELELDEASAALQRPHNPQFYPQHGAAARAFAWPLTGQTQGPDMTCYLSQLEVPGPDPEGVTADMVSRMSAILEIPSVDNGEDDDAAVESALEGIIDSSGDGESAELRVHMPEDAEGEFSHQWLTAHWAVATAEEYGIQTVTSAPYRWDRDSARWQRLTEDEADAAPAGTVLIGFAREP
ncbi:hypothetical protein [Nesterenkonia sphaerica]|uniref:Heavy metal transporter n=1 Tax=Nesterenkonia sphaerica TaxID=1804988 RepID=A0A5R9AD78_9MICC|nr:hypothetical protein [Nesterenkonia sphaerica]TLP75827.1 hypothetical protein FEF27_07320 [Nesterenkonia sphaerica]